MSRLHELPIALEARHLLALHLGGLVPSPHGHNDLMQILALEGSSLLRI